MTRRLMALAKEPLVYNFDAEHKRRVGALAHLAKEIPLKKVGPGVMDDYKCDSYSTYINQLRLDIKMCMECDRLGIPGKILYLHRLFDVIAANLHFLELPIMCVKKSASTNATTVHTITYKLIEWQAFYRNILDLSRYDVIHEYIRANHLL